MTTSGAHLRTAFLAAPPTPPPGKGAEWGKAAPIGLLILVLLGIALYLLIKSMNKHMRKVGAVTSFDMAAPEAPAATAATETPSAGTAAGAPGSADAAAPEERQSPADGPAASGPAT